MPPRGQKELAVRWVCTQEKGTPLYMWSEGKPPHYGQSMKDKEEPPLQRAPRKASQGKETGAQSLGAGKTLALCQEPNFTPKILEGFRKDQRDPAYTDTHSDSV